MTPTNCGHCRFYRPCPPEDGADFGQCRRYAPWPTQSGPVTVVWPEVRQVEWCGDWQPVEPDPAEHPAARLAAQWAEDQRKAEEWAWRPERAERNGDG